MIMSANINPTIIVEYIHLLRFINYLQHHINASKATLFILIDVPRSTGAHLTEVHAHKLPRSASDLIFQTTRMLF